MPKKHRADFGDIQDNEKADLALALRNSLAKLYEKLNNPDYNYIINTAARYKGDEPQLHWYLQIRPQLTTQAGFEIGSGISINPSIPEKDANFLKTTEGDDGGPNDE
jgi:UDPglucose--hexose-1-phosphate uridylyltransferase